jgi:hypothetical protein
MRKTILILLLILNFPSYAQDKSDKYFAIFKDEVQRFIDTIKHSAPGLSKYYVYRIHMYDPSPDTNAMCFEISYFETSLEYIYPSPPCVFMLRNEIILINNPEGIAKQWIDKKYIIPVDSAQKKKIFKKLPGDLILRDGEYEKTLYWYDGSIVRRRFCDDPWNPLHENKLCSYNNFSEVKASFYNDSVNGQKKLLKSLPHNYLIKDK